MEAHVRSTHTYAEAATRAQEGHSALGSCAVLRRCAVHHGDRGAAASAAVVSGWLDNLPDPDKPGAFEVAQCDQNLLGGRQAARALYLENREVVPISRISSDLVNGVIATEDERFSSTTALTSIGLATRGGGQPFPRASAPRAPQRSPSSTSATRFCSTSAPTFHSRRKVREAYLAMNSRSATPSRDPRDVPQRRLLRRGAYGAQAASRTYFAKHCERPHAGAGRLAGGSASAAEPTRPLQQPGRCDPAPQRRPVLGCPTTATSPRPSTTRRWPRR